MPKLLTQEVIFSAENWPALIGMAAGFTSESAILEADRTGPVKQRHTAKRIFEPLRDEHGFGGGYTMVKDYVRIARARRRETFVPLSHPPAMRRWILARRSR